MLCMLNDIKLMPTRSLWSWFSWWCVWVTRECRAVEVGGPEENVDKATNPAITNAQIPKSARIPRIILK